MEKYMNTERKMTGYASIDKPWLNYYTKEAVEGALPQITMYEYLLKNNGNHFDDVALDYFGNQITYNELFSNIDKVANALTSYGVKEGDVVTIQALSLPQVVYMIYALSKIGAVANLIYVTSTAVEIRDNLFQTKTKIFVVMDSIFENIDMDISNPYLKEIILVSVEDEMPALMKVACKIKTKSLRKKCENNAIKWNEFLTKGTSVVGQKAGNSESPVIMVYTGGTTGKSKAVILSNRNMNVGALQYIYLGFERNKTLLCVLPPFIAFGLTVTLHMPLVFGLKTVLCVSSNPTEIGDFVERNKPNYIICGTAQAEKMMDSLNEKNVDLSALSLLGVGGDALTLSLESRINEFLAKHNSKTKIIQGYAMSETSASSTAAVHTIHKKGTVGIPFVYTTIKIVDTDTNEEVAYNEKGEICINSPSVMKGYFENKEETDNILRKHKDGKVWVHTGDIGSMDEEGFLTIWGRIKRIILVSENGLFHKVFPKNIEDKFLKSGCVKSISIVGRKNKRKTNELVAFIVLDNNDTKTQVIEQLKKYAENTLERFERPDEYIVLERLPLTTVGKVNYRLLEKQAQK